LLLFIGPVIIRLHRALGNERVEGTASELVIIASLISGEPDSYRGFLSGLSTCIVTQNGPPLDRVSAGSGPLDVASNNYDHHMLATDFVAHVTMSFAASGSVPSRATRLLKTTSQALGRHSHSSHGACYLSVHAPVLCVVSSEGGGPSRARLVAFSLRPGRDPWPSSMCS
jgi:hypothetical protein